MTNTKELEMIYKHCKLLNVECIKQELDKQLEDYIFKKIERKNDEWTIFFKGLDEEYMILSISSNRISIIKKDKISAERVVINEEMSLIDRFIDKRQNGVIYSVVKKKFMPSLRFNKVVLTDLMEQRYTLTKNKINSLININFDNTTPSNLLLKLRTLETKENLSEQSDAYNEFSTHMNYYHKFDNVRKAKDNIYPTRTYLNGEKFSSLFDIDGADKLYRIYDLYNGIINTCNEKDIISINLGFLSPDIFNFKELKGINKQEDSLVGKPLKDISDNYLSYLTSFFYNKLGFKGEFELSRDSILKAITYQISNFENSKRLNSIDVEMITCPDINTRQLDIESEIFHSKNILKRLLKPFFKR